LRTLTAKVQSLGRGVGKNVVISVIQVWKFNLRAHLYRQERWNERQIFLRDLFRRQRSWTWESAIQIDHRKGWLRGKDPAFGDDLVPFRLNRGSTRLRQFHTSFHRGARQKRSGKN